MKKILLFLLAGWMFVSAFAQIDVSKINNTETSNKWVITPVAKMKGVLGRLNMDFPAGVEWSIGIYTQAENKFVNSYREFHHTKFYDIAPGEYRLVFNNYLPIENVSIQKGKETRIRAGVLNTADFVAEGYWTLYDETKKIYYYSDYEPKKIAFPVGIYQLKAGDNFVRVEINDIVPVNKENPEIIETDKWILTPINENLGRLITKIYNPFTFGWAIKYILTVNKDGHTIFYCRDSDPGMSCGQNPVLDEGDYDIAYTIDRPSGESFAPILLNIPIRKGYETRLKVGYLSHTPGVFTVFDESGQNKYMGYIRQSDAGFPLPVGKYLVSQNCVGDYHAEVKDGKTEILNPIPTIESKITSKYIITPVTGGKPPLKPNLGRLNCRFPLADTVIFSIQIPKTGGGFSTVRLDTMGSIDLGPGKYVVRLSGNEFSITIQEGKQTIIRVGYLKNATDRRQAVKDVKSTSNISGFTFAQKTIPLPIGFYYITIDPVNGTTYRYLARIKNSEIVTFTYAPYTN